MRSSDRRTDLITMLLSLWIIVDMSCMLVVSKYAYDFDLRLKFAPGDLFMKILSSLPEQMYILLKENGWIITIGTLISSLLMLKRDVGLLGRLVQLVLYNIHYAIVYSISSGATTIVACSLSYLFLMDLASRAGLYNKKYNFLYGMILTSFKIQVSIVYLISGLAKWQSSLWRSGAATFYIFNNDRYSKLSSVVQIFNSSQWLIKFVTYSGMIFLVTFPFAIWTKRKMPFLIFSLCFHTFIAVFMGLREFMIFPLLDFLLFSDEEILGKISNITGSIINGIKSNRKNYFRVG